MILLFFLCTVAGRHIVDKQLLTAWNPPDVPHTNKVEIVRGQTEDDILQYIKNYEDLQGYQQDGKQTEIDNNENEHNLQFKNDDIQLAFDDEARVLLKKLTKALENLNKNIEKLNSKTKTRSPVYAVAQPDNNKLYIVKVPKKSNRDRYVRSKRDTDKVEDVENNTITVSTTEAVTTEVNNATLDATSEADNSTDFVPGVNCNQTLNTRRNFNDDLEVSNAVKARLLSYIKEYFNDIETKINSLRNVKKAFNSDSEYNIGYMIANIDMLEVNLRNLKAEMEKNRHELGEKHILDMFDKVKVSNNLVTSLISALKSILERKASKAAQPQPGSFYSNSHFT